MQAKAAQFDLFAEECDRRADTGVDRQAIAVFREMAVQWRELASMQRAIDAAALRTSGFIHRFRGGDDR